MKSILRVVYILMISSFCTSIEADERILDAAAIAKKIPPAKVEDVRAIDGGLLYEVRLGSSRVYVTGNGQYMVAGDLFDVDQKRNLSEERRLHDRRLELAKVSDADAIVFDAEGELKRTITVFTDVDCSYCRKFHQDIEQINMKGVRVRYLAYPRTGPGTESWAKAESVWCDEDRRGALTRAKRGESISSKSCESPVPEQFRLGERIGIRGTPMIVMDDGTIVGGYLNLEQLFARLDELGSPSSASLTSDE